MGTVVNQALASEHGGSLKLHLRLSTISPRIDMLLL